MQHCEVSPNWVWCKAAPFPGAFISRLCFFQTGWAGEEDLVIGLVGFSGAILPSWGSSFTKAKAVKHEFPWGLAVKKSLANSKAEWALTKLDLLYLNLKVFQELWAKEECWWRSCWMNGRAFPLTVGRSRGNHSEPMQSFWVFVSCACLLVNELVGLTQDVPVLWSLSPIVNKVRLRVRDGNLIPRDISQQPVCNLEFSGTPKSLVSTLNGPSMAWGKGVHATAKPSQYTSEH